MNGFEDGDGCPDAAAGELAQAAQRVVFAKDSAQWRPESLAALKSLAALLRDADESMGSFELVARADARGANEANRKLAQKRAEAVRKWLAGQSGVIPERLTAVGADAVAGTDPRACRRQSQGWSFVRGAPGGGAFRRQTRWPHSSCSPAGPWSAGGDGAGMVVAGPDASHYSVYSIVKTDQRTALYARDATGREIDVVVARLAGEPLRAALRDKEPAAIGAAAGAPVRKQWTEGESGAASLLPFPGAARPCKDCVGNTPVILVHQPQGGAAYARSMPLQFAVIASGLRVAPGGLSVRVALQGPGLSGPRTWDLRDSSPLKIEGLSGRGYAVTLALVDASGRPAAPPISTALFSVQGEAEGEYATNPCAAGAILASGGSFAWSGPAGESRTFRMQDFCMDLRPVTNQEYARCVADRKCPAAGQYGQDDTAGGVPRGKRQSCAREQLR